MAKTYNVDIVGNLTNNNGVLSGFSTNDYAYFNNPVGAISTSKFEAGIKINITSSYDYTRVLAGSTNSNQTFGFYISANGYLCFNVGPWSVVGNQTVVSVGTSYYVKFILDTDTGFASLYSSLTGEFNGEEVLERQANNSTAKELPSIFYIGTSFGTSYSFSFGEVDLNECYIKNDGTVVWQGVSETPTPSVPIPKIGSDDISKIYLGSEEISKIYLGSELVYEAEVTPPAPTGPVFDLYASTYDTSLGNWSDKDAFLRGENISLTLYRQPQQSTYNIGINLLCDDWTDAAKIQMYSDSGWALNNIGYYDSLGQWQTISATTSNNIITILLTSSIRSKIQRLWATANTSYYGTFSNFKVYDDNDNIIIPAS